VNERLINNNNQAVINSMGNLISLNGYSNNDQYASSTIASNSNQASQAVNIFNNKNASHSQEQSMSYVNMNELNLKNQSNPYCNFFLAGIPLYKYKNFVLL
jgi:hypothetical protein